MKYYSSLAMIVGLLFLFFACEKDEANDSVETISTKVVGNVADITRNIKHKDFKVVVQRVTYGGGGWSGYGITDVVRIDSTYTDSQGNYEIDFDYILDTKYQYHIATDFVSVGNGPFVDYIDEDATIYSGITNIINLDFWYASILKLELTVANNVYPPLGVSNNLVSGKYYSFMGAEIYEAQTDTVIYIPTKPNTEIELLFGYATGYSNSEYHPKYEYITTGIQDTLSYNFQIDCTTF